MRMETVPLVEVKAPSKNTEKASMTLPFLGEGTISYSSSEYQVCRYSNVNYFTLSTVKLFDFALQYKIG